jgi:hypothetical protein
MTEEKVLEIILRALGSVNDELPDDKKFAVGPKTSLFGVDATLDSLSLVSVIVDVEGEVGSVLGRSISLTDDRAMSQPVSPFDSVQTLLDYIMVLVVEVQA